MIITNNFNLPRAFVEMAQDDYVFEPNEYRVTSLLKGLRETILERRHQEKIERDVSDMIWLLFGTAVHNILEHQEEADTELKEERIKVNIGDYVLSGKFDLYCGKQKKITDYKTASVWKIIYQNYDDWRTQLLIYSWLMRKIGFKVDCAETVALLKDHSKRDAKFKPEYPKLPVHIARFDFTEKDFEEIEDWLNNKFREIKVAEQLSDEELPLCTLEERFNDGGKWAVMNGKNKRAIRVLDSKEEAEKYMETTGKGTHIEHRPGEDKKCDDYCSVNEFCSYWKSKKGVEAGGQHENIQCG